MTVTPADRGPQVSGTAGAFLALSTIAILLRCYCRAFLVKSFGLDDWSALVAWLFFVFFAAFAITGVYHGTGQHTVDLPPSEIPIGLKWWWACEPVYVLANMALKFSISVMLLRIAVSRVHRIIIWTVTVVVEVYGAFYFFLFVLQCQPSSYFWTRFAGATEGTCINPVITVNATYAYSAISCWVDWTLAIIPIFIVRNLQMNIRTKISVALILAMGAIASTATIIRTPYVRDLANQADFLYATTDIAIWSTAETGMGLAASSFATLRPLFRDFFSRSRLWGGSSKTNASPWRGTGPNGMNGASSRGYIRSGSKGGVEEFGLRSDVGQGQGITTICESDVEIQGGRGIGVLRKDPGGDIKRTGSVGGMGRGGWNNSESKLTDVEMSSSDDGEPRLNWERGIRKTVIQTRIST